MKSTSATLSILAAASVSLAGCQGVHVANLLTMCVTFGLFFGTLNLGKTRSNPAQKPAASDSATTSAAPK